jgi:hypothetical protein
MVARASKLDSRPESSDHAPSLQPTSGIRTLIRGSPAVALSFPLPAPCLALVLLAASGAALAADADMVNERPPVTREQLEQHWGVDCEALRRELLAAGAQSGLGASPVAAHEDAPTRIARWRAGMRLCAAIHNAPGNDAALPCPDYARAARALGAEPAGRDVRLQADIGEALRCDP